MAQPEGDKEVQLVDIIFFCAERLTKVVAIFGVVSLVSIITVFAKHQTSKEGETLYAGGAEISEKELVKVSVLIQLPYIVDAWGVFRPIVSPNLLKELYSGENLDISIIEKDYKDQPTAALWVSASNIKEVEARKLVVGVAENIVKFAIEAQMPLVSLEGQYGGRFSVIGQAKIAKYDVTNVLPGDIDSRANTSMTGMLKIGVLSLLFGAFASVIYLFVDKVRFDYRQKYPKSSI